MEQLLQTHYMCSGHGPDVLDVMDRLITKTVDTTLDTHLRTWQEGHVSPEDCHSHTYTHTHTDYCEVSGSSPLQMFDVYLKKQ